MSSHYRNMSPSRGRHSMIDPMRASTGMVQLNSSYDPYDAPRRYDYEDYPSDTGYASAFGYRSGRPSKLEAHQISSHRVQDPTASAKKRTEYTVQPRTRHRSHTSTAADYETPVRLAVPSSSRQHLSPVHQHHPTHRRTPSPLPTDSGHHIVSASPRNPAHRRIYSTDYTSDTGHIDPRNDASHRTDHSSHHPRVHPPTRPRYPAYDGLRKGDDIDDFDAYSYTNAREQFDRDYPVKARHRGPRYSLDRPLSITGAEDPQWTARKERHHGPPPTSWGLDKMGRERPRSSAYGKDDHREPHRSKDGFHDQALVAAPQDSDGEYPSRHDERRRRRRAYKARHANDRESHYPEDHHSKPHDSGALATMGLGTAALGGGYSDMSDYEHHRPSRHKHRRPHGEHDRDAVQPPSRELVEAVPADERTKQAYLDPADARRHGRTRHHSRRRTHSDDGDTSDEDLRNYRREPARHRHSITDTDSDRDRDRSRGHSHHRRDRDHSRGYRSSRSYRTPEDGHAIEPRRSPPVDMAKDDPRRLIAVEPAAPKEPDAPPKGILKAPRPAFPEEPNPVREGVAPLKDAHKQGIPPGARWTKIDRRLVNPEALEAGNERFEERSDYVIVLRVLSKEEIQQYAVKTQEIRDTRHKEQLRDRRKSRDETHRHGRRGEESSSDDEDEGEEEPWKQLEAAATPTAPKISLPSRPRASTNSMHEAERPRMSNPSAAPV
ncbi:hypothetical protein N7517_009681 [Penicillium concentricum]|uniref:DUF8035 domain-containing protein n=1 Tax=Penicillium concentricum TaxID=293559 RepID=A0A9W9UZ47_9EURO|nr:uncharacterized protein N7517_009681 [Penicillium concentricum]KAJ5360490.1 hypothetical protein N7517_009681 [Penicillium concentricum]